MDCIFCKIINKEIDAYIILETDNFVSLLDIHPCAPGHTLIVPKKHIENFVDLPEDLMSEFMQIAKQTILLLSKALDTNDFTVGINEGPVAGRAIHHLHLHLIPRFSNDGGGSIHSIVKNPPKESIAEIYQKIINARQS